jgi:hypothetical protein
MKNIESIDHLIIQNEVNLDFHASFGLSLNTFFFFGLYVCHWYFGCCGFCFNSGINRYCCFI